MSEKFLGVGLVNALGIALFALLVSVTLKVIFTTYHVNGVSEVIQAS